MTESTFPHKLTWEYHEGSRRVTCGQQRLEHGRVQELGCGRGFLLTRSNAVMHWYKQHPHLDHLLLECTACNLSFYWFFLTEKQQADLVQAGVPVLEDERASGGLKYYFHITQGADTPYGSSDIDSDLATWQARWHKFADEDGNFAVDINAIMRILPQAPESAPG